MTETMLTRATTLTVLLEGRLAGRMLALPTRNVARFPCRAASRTGWGRLSSEEKARNAVTTASPSGQAVDVANEGTSSPAAPAAPAAASVGPSPGPQRARSLNGECRDIDVDPAGGWADTRALPPTQGNAATSPVAVRTAENVAFHAAAPTTIEPSPNWINAGITWVRMLERSRSARTLLSIKVGRVADVPHAQGRSLDPPSFLAGGPSSSSSPLPVSFPKHLLACITLFRAHLLACITLFRANWCRSWRALAMNPRAR